MQMCCTQGFHMISHVKTGKSQAKTYWPLKQVCGDDSLSVITCRKWYLPAKSGDETGKDLPRSGGSVVKRTLSNVSAVGVVLDRDRWATVRKISAEVKLSKGTVHSILNYDLELSKKAPKFVLCVLTEDQNRLCIQLCWENLKDCYDPLFLWYIITEDESWFSVLEPEQKQKSCQWMSKYDRRPKKASCSMQARKTFKI